MCRKKRRELSLDCEFGIVYAVVVAVVMMMEEGRERMNERG